MRISSSVPIALALSALVASPAGAGKPKVKAQFLCGVMAGGKITDPLPDSKKPKITDPVACSLHVDDAGGEDGTLTVIKTVRTVIDPASGKKSKVDGANITGSVEKGPDGAYKDTDALLKPNVADANGQIAFRSCEDFDVSAVIGDAGGTFFTKTVHIAQTCPKPKAMKATVSCIAHRDDGSTYQLPSKDKRRLTNLSSITCLVVAKDDRLAAPGTKFAGTMHSPPSDPSSKTARVSDERIALAPVAEGETYSAEVAFQTGDWDECAMVTAVVAVTSADGTALFAKTIAFSQRCDD